MKTCPDCGMTAPASTFPRNRGRPTSYCRPCKNARAAATNRKHGRRNAQIRRRTGETRRWLDTLKSSTPCADCGGTFPPCVMDFDHRPECDKTTNVSRLMRNGTSRARILEEVEKCDLVCANCHRIRTHTRNQYCSSDATPMSLPLLDYMENGK